MHSILNSLILCFLESEWFWLFDIFTALQYCHSTKFWDDFGIPNWPQVQDSCKA